MRLYVGMCVYPYVCNICCVCVYAVCVHLCMWCACVCVCVFCMCVLVLSVCPEVSLPLITGCYKLEVLLLKLSRYTYDAMFHDYYSCG